VGRILFVDDDTDALAMYIKAVSLASHQADVASSSLDGWELIKKNKYDLIRAKGIPVIVISAMPEDAQVEEVLNAGASLFLEKPVALVDLLAIIDQFEK